MSRPYMIHGAESTTFVSYLAKLSAGLPRVHIVQNFLERRAPLLPHGAGKLHKVAGGGVGVLVGYRGPLGWKYAAPRARNGLMQFRILRGPAHERNDNGVSIAHLDAG